MLTWIAMMECRDRVWPTVFVARDGPVPDVNFEFRFICHLHENGFG
jgi:hypothetical protein